MELDAELMAVTPRRATVANRDATYRHVDPWMPEAYRRAASPTGLSNRVSWTGIRAREFKVLREMVANFSRPLRLLQSMLMPVASLQSSAPGDQCG